MKLKNIIPQRHRHQLIRQFGQARLVRRPNGEHELLGGTDADRAAAFEWASLFAHEIVFTHFHREPAWPRRAASASSAAAGCLLPLASRWDAPGFPAMPPLDVRRYLY